MMPQARVAPKPTSGKQILHFFLIILIAGSIAVCIVLERYELAVAVGGFPILAALSGHLLKYPHFFILGIAATHMLDIQLKVAGLSINMALVALCLLSIVLNRKKIKINTDMRFLIFLILYIVYIIGSYLYTRREINFYDVNLYANNIIILMLMFVFDDVKKIEQTFFVILSCSLFLVFSGFYEILTTGLQGSKMTGYWPNHVRYSLHMAWGIPLCFYFYKTRKKFLFIILLAILCTGILLAFSRGVIMALILAAAITAVYYGFRTTTLKNRLLYLFSACLLGVSLSLLLGSIDLNYRSYDPVTLKKITSGRSILYESAWDIFSKNPVFGTGWDNYKHIWHDYADINPAYMKDKELNPHSSYLKILSELGLIGIMLYALFNLYLWKSVRQVFLTSLGLPLLCMLFIYYFHGLVDNNSYGNDRMFYLVSGLLFSLKAMNGKERVLTLPPGEGEGQKS